MDKKLHFIWGNPSFERNRIHLLRANGCRKIYVLTDHPQAKIKEKREVTYLPRRYKPFIKMDNPNYVHHLFLSIPHSNSFQKRREDELAENDELN